MDIDKGVKLINASESPELDEKIIKHLLWTSKITTLIGGLVVIGSTVGGVAIVVLTDFNFDQKFIMFTTALGIGGYIGDREIKHEPIERVKK